MQAAFQADQDIHAVTASKLFGVDIDKVDRAQRGLAKTINFATIYGVSAFGIVSRTELNMDEARKFLDQYFATYPKIQEYIDATLAKAKTDGYVETLLGRKRFFPELQEGRLPVNQRMAVERAAMNAPIQGTAADIMKMAMINLHRELKAGGYQARMLLQVHDELVLEVPPDERATVVNLVRETMESAYELSVPLKVDVEVGQNWYEMEAGVMPEQPRILISDPLADVGVAPLRDAPNLHVDIRTDLTPQALLETIPDYHALLVRSGTQVTADVIQAGKRLRVIARAGVGVDNIDVVAATQAGIIVVNAPTGNTVAAAEQTIALLMAVARRLPQADAHLRAGEWQRSRFCRRRGTR